MSDDKNTLLVRHSENPAFSDFRRLDRLFQSVFGESPLFGTRHVQAEAGYGWAPAVDIRETDAELIVYAALPGLDKEEVGLEVKDNTLVLNGRMKPLGSDEDAWVRRELPRGEFYRAFHLSADVQVDKVKAAMRNGVLEIRLPKTESARPRKVEIE